MSKDIFCLFSVISGQLVLLEARQSAGLLGDPVGARRLLEAAAAQLQERFLDEGRRRERE